MRAERGFFLFLKAGLSTTKRDSGGGGGVPSTPNSHPHSLEIVEQRESVKGSVTKKRETDKLYRGGVNDLLYRRKLPVTKRCGTHHCRFMGYLERPSAQSDYSYQPYTRTSSVLS